MHDPQATREWLKDYTWVQPDGSTDYSKPRLRGSRNEDAEQQELDALGG